MIQRIFALFLCLLLLSPHIAAVVNNVALGASTAADDINTSGKIRSSSSSSTHSGNTKLTDSIAAASSNDQQPNRREAPIVPHEVYGPPANSYVPSSALSNTGLPVPVYGVPDGPANNVIYSNPSADILPAISSSFSAFNDLYAKRPSLPETYGPPKTVYTSLKGIFGGASQKYVQPPQVATTFPKFTKPSYGGHLYKPKQQYGLPFGAYGPVGGYGKTSFKPKPYYGPPKAQFGHVKPTYVPPKPGYGLPLSSFNQNSAIYGPPPSPSYGPPLNTAVNPGKTTYRLPDPVPHGPPHPGAPAPPTPPDIKYDGWQPMPGYVSRPPSDSYGVPIGEPHSTGVSQFNHDLVPPPAVPNGGVSSLSLGSSYGSSAGISDSYGAPLNTVTGSGHVVSTSGDSHIQNQEQNTISLGLAAAGIGNGHDGQLSVIKSIGYEIYPKGTSGGHQYNNIAIGSDSYSAPSTGVGYHGNFGKGMSFSTSGLIPPNGVYGVPTSGQYGTPLLHNPPKKPISFRDVVPQSLIQSITASIGSSPQIQSAPSYIPPNVLTNLYSLPQTQTNVQFHSNSFSGQEPSYGAPLLNLNRTYGVPQQGGITLGIDNSYSGQSIDLTHLGTSSHGDIPLYDCNSHKLQSAPQLSYGVPSALSMKSNVRGSDLQTAYSVGQPASVNTIDDKEAQRYQYTMTSGLVPPPGGELINSQSIDFNNIPLQGQLGTYTLQIQPANGAAGTDPSSGQVPHHQVLNDGLLQSILAAIEQPQQKGASFAAIPIEQQQPQVHLSNDFQLPSEQAPIAFVDSPGDVVQGSSNLFMEVSTKNALLQDLLTPTEATLVAEDNHQLIDDNQIALYFNNNMQTSEESAAGAKDAKSEKVAQTTDEAAAVQAGQSGSYVKYPTA